MKRKENIIKEKRRNKNGKTWWGQLEGWKKRLEIKNNDDDEYGWINKTRIWRERDRRRKRKVRWRTEEICVGKLILSKSTEK